MYFLVENIENAIPESVNGPGFSLVLVLILGFIAAAGIGSIAWYNSKRPLGWEEKKRPDLVPDIDTGEE